MPLPRQRPHSNRPSPITYAIAALLWLLIVGAGIAVMVWLVRTFNPCFC
jgi:hypothetical protein